MRSPKVVPVLRFKKRLQFISVNDIESNPRNPRELIGRKEVADIRESIKTMGGVLVPVVVYEERGKFILLDGERRWRASKELARVDPEKYGHIPANIIEKPLSPIENLETMFNIHQKRKEWSTAANAAAVNEILKLKGDMSVRELMQVTCLPRVEINDALLFRKFPAQILKRCLDGKLDEFYPILLGRNLQSCEKIFPDFMKRYNWEGLAECFITKVDKGFIRNSRDFMILSRIARTCALYDVGELFESLFERMVGEEDFTPRGAEKLMERELGYKLEKSFRNTCNDFLNSLISYIANKSKTKSTIPNDTMVILKKLYNNLKRIVEKKK